MADWTPFEFCRAANPAIPTPLPPPPAVVLTHADAHFRMGSGHEAEGTPCQDYALADAAAARPFAVLSDGCSSSGRTDVGARLLALATRTLLREGTVPDPGTPPVDWLRAGVLARAEEGARLLGLDLGDLDATLGVVCATPGGGGRAFLWGDGVIAARCGRTLEITVVDWAGNMPGYPSYWLDSARRQAFVAESTTLASAAGRAPCRVTHHRVEDGRIETVGCDELSAAVGLGGTAIDWTTGPDVVAVMSDGVLQVAGAEWGEVVGALMAVKSAREGAFMTRRMGRALAELAKRGCRPTDDIAVAALASSAAGGTNV